MPNLDNDNKETRQLKNAQALSLAEQLQHDLCTPLMGIESLAMLIAHKAEDADIKQYANAIINAAHALIRYQKITLSCSEAKATPLIVCNLVLLLTEVIECLQPKAISKNIRLSLEITNPLPKTILANPRVIFSILLELTANAIKYTDAGSVVLRVASQMLQKNQSQLMIEVRDTGCGIAEENIKHIFVPGFRMDSRESGEGFGLSLVKSHVESMRGELSVVSHAQGTSIFCNLPVFTANIANVLLVEDDEISAFAEKDLLEMLGCTVTRCATAKNALEISLKNHYDFVLLDLFLAETKDISIVKTFVSKGCYVVVITAYVDASLLLRCIEAGALFVFQKPLKIQDVEKILNFLNQHSSNNLRKYKFKDEDNEKSNNRSCIRCETIGKNRVSCQEDACYAYPANE